MLNEYFLITFIKNRKKLNQLLDEIMSLNIKTPILYFFKKNDNNENLTYAL